MTDRKWTLDWAGQAMLILTILLVIWFVLYRVEESRKQTPISDEQIESATKYLFNRTDSILEIKDSSDSRKSLY